MRKSYHDPASGWRYKVLKHVKLLNFKDYGRELDSGYSGYPGITEEVLMDIVGVTLRAHDGRELKTLAWFPTEAVRRDFYEKASKRGLEVIIND